MKHKRLCFLVFSVPMFLLLSFLLPASIVKAANAASPITGSLLQSRAQQNWRFPCSDRVGRNRILQPAEDVISKDWLSGTVGRFSKTYPEDTYAFPQVTTLFSYMEILAFLLITPSTLLLGYQVMLGASTFRYASACEGLSRVVLGGVAVAVSFALIQLLMNLENSFATALFILHIELPFPRSAINRVPVAYTLPGEPVTSYRGMLIPMSRWGCAANNFIAIFSPTLIADFASDIPLLGKFVPLTGPVQTMADLIHRIGEITLTALSFLLWLQVFARILLLNFYILVTPLAFGCWAMPGGIGQNVVRQWGKGFLSILFVQVVQVFILTTLPLLMPPLPQSYATVGGEGILQSLLLQFPPILTLCVTLMAPTLVGASINKALGTATSVAKEVVVAVGTGIETGRRSMSPTKEAYPEDTLEEPYKMGEKWTLTRRSRERNRLSEEERSSI
jgi:hypothetical protein